MKKISISTILASTALAMAFITTNAGATEVDACEHGIKVGSVEGQIVKIKDSDRAYDVGTENEGAITGWGEDNYLRLCNDQLTNISFRTLPTYKVTPVSTTKAEPPALTPTAPAEPAKSEPAPEQLAPVSPYEKHKITT